MTEFIFAAVIIGRIVIPLFIPRFPLPAIIAALVLDAVDQTVFQTFTDDPLEWYQTYDKALDIFYLSIAYMSAMRNWREPVAFDIARFLFIYRLIGVAMFEATEQRWMLMVFPNTFEYYFIAYEAIRTRWNPFKMAPRTVFGIAAFIWLVIKLPQEWWIHVAQLDFTDFMEERPILWIPLLGLAGGAAFFGYQNRHKLPPADWPFTMRVDTHLNVAHLEGTRGERFFSAILAEKIVVCSLIVAIFSQVIPNVQATAGQLLFGSALLVIANTLVSQAVRHFFGTVWASVFTQFLATLGINIAIIWADARFAGDPRVFGLTWDALFFVTLLSFLVAMFDRYRSTRNPEEKIDVVKTLWTGEISPPNAVRPDSVG